MGYAAMNYDVFVVDRIGKRKKVIHIHTHRTDGGIERENISMLKYDDEHEKFLYFILFYFILLVLSMENGSTFPWK